MAFASSGYIGHATPRAAISVAFQPWRTGDVGGATAFWNCAIRWLVVKIPAPPRTTVSPAGSTVQANPTRGAKFSRSGSTTSCEIGRASCRESEEYAGEGL